jgi:hypothetical protein
VRDGRTISFFAPVEDRSQKRKKENSARERKDAQNGKGSRCVSQVPEEGGLILRGPRQAVSWFHEQMHEILKAAHFIQG